MKANKKMIQQQLCHETGKVILLKDLSNIITANKSGKSRNDLNSTVTLLMDTYDMFDALCFGVLYIVFNAGARLRCTRMRKNTSKDSFSKTRK